MPTQDWLSLCSVCLYCLTTVCMDWKGKLQYQWPMVVCTPLPPERSGAPRYCHASGNCAALSRLVTTRYNFIMFCSPPSLLRHVHWLLCRVIKTSLFLGKVFTDCRLLILKHQTSKSMKVYHEVLSLWWKFPGSVKVETKELCSLHPVVTRSSDPWPWVSRERERRGMVDIMSQIIMTQPLTSASHFIIIKPKGLRKHLDNHIGSNLVLSMIIWRGF